jgi:hypothetical protein
MDIRIQTLEICEKEKEMLSKFEKYYINQMIHFLWIIKFLI